MFSGYWGSLQGVERPEREVDRSYLSNAEFNEENYGCASSVCLFGMDRDNFTFLYLSLLLHSSVKHIKVTHSETLLHNICTGLEVTCFGLDSSHRQIYFYQKPVILDSS